MGDCSPQQLVDTAHPREWQCTLETAPERFCTNPRTPRPPQTQQSDFVSTTLGTVLEVVEAPSLVRAGTAQPHQRQGNIARLCPVGLEVSVNLTQVRATGCQLGIAPTNIHEQHLAVVHAVNPGSFTPHLDLLSTEDRSEKRLRGTTLQANLYARFHRCGILHVL